MKIPALRRSRAGFTLVELITVVSVIVLLFALVAGAYTYADKSAKRNRTEVSIRVIRSALENYREKFGAYPEPANAAETVTITFPNADTYAATMFCTNLNWGPVAVNTRMQANITLKVSGAITIT